MNTYTFFDLYPYLLLLISLLLIFLSKMRENLKSKWCLAILLFFTVCRYNVGWDYESYVVTIRDWGGQWNVGRYSPLSNLIFYLGYKLQFYPIVFAIYGCIQLYLLKYVIDNLSINRALSWLYFLLIPVFFLQGLSTIRQAVANGFVFVSLLLLCQKNYKKALGMYIFAILFHVSAVLSIFMFPVVLMRIPNKWNWLLFVSSFFIGNLLVSNIVNLGVAGTAYSRFMYYIEEYESHKTSLLNYYYYSINVGLLYLSGKLSRINPLLGKLVTIGNLGIVLYNIFSFEPVTATRLASMYTIVWIVILPYVPFALAGSKKIQIKKGQLINNISLLLPISFVFCYFLMSYVTAFNNHRLMKISFIPYEFWWDNL